MTVLLPQSFNNYVHKSIFKHLMILNARELFIMGRDIGVVTISRIVIVGDRKPEKEMRDAGRKAGVEGLRGSDTPTQPAKPMNRIQYPGCTGDSPIGTALKDVADVYGMPKPGGRPTMDGSQCGDTNKKMGKEAQTENGKKSVVSVILSVLREMKNGRISIELIQNISDEIAKKEKSGTVLGRVLSDARENDKERYFRLVGELAKNYAEIYSSQKHEKNK